MSEWVASTLAAMTIEEKVSLVSGRDLWHTKPIDRLGVPSLRVSDGPNGVRGTDDDPGLTSTSFPVGAAMGATFDPDLIESVGKALAHETRAKGASVLLGPTVNIPRIPNAGRNFECFSEDPFLSGTVAAAYIRGIQGEGIAACLKHFVCNDQEHDRFTIDAVVDDRALREVYLEPFRIAVEASRPWAVMSAYNTINGITASEHPMLDATLRDEFGFDGVVISDWYGTYGPGVVSSGLDLEMPGPARWLEPERLLAAMTAGEITEADVDRKVRRILTLLERTGVHEGGGPAAERADEREADRRLARRVAIESMVLLTNDGTLPLARESRIAVIGEHAVRTPHQGGGSSAVNPHRVVSILSGIEQAAGPTARVDWSLGCRSRRNPPPLDPTLVTHGGDAPGFLAEYFAGTGFDGPPVSSVTTSRSYIGFFGPGSRGVEHERFSLRLSGRYRAAHTGRHGFAAAAAGRLRVMADGARVVDDWESPAAEPHSWEMDLAAGDSVDLVVEYASVPGERWRFVSVGVDLPGPEDPIAEAVAAATDADVAVIVAGLSAEWESEGFDRPDLRLPGDQDRMIAAVAAVQPNTVVVITAGSPLEMPWLDDVGAVVLAWYGGQEVGHAVADVLFGAEDPGGRLPVTFPADSRQHPGMLNYPGEGGRVRYGEGVYAAYRAFDHLGLTPLFPFGHGLSYTTFEFGEAAAVADDGVVVSGVLTNTGSRPGTEVIQVFGRDIGGVDRRLVGFGKVKLGQGQSRSVRLTVAKAQLRWWDPAIGGWSPAAGRLDLEVSGSTWRQDLSVDLGAG